MDRRSCAFCRELSRFTVGGGAGYTRYDSAAWLELVEIDVEVVVVETELVEWPEELILLSGLGGEETMRGFRSESERIKRYGSGAGPQDRAEQ